MVTKLKYYADGVLVELFPIYITIIICLFLILFISSRDDSDWLRQFTVYVAHQSAPSSPLPEKVMCFLHLKTNEFNFFSTTPLVHFSDPWPWGRCLASPLLLVLTYKVSLVTTNVAIKQ